MYYFIYALLYLVSLLPMFILYRFSDLACFIIYHIVRYRRDIVNNNLDIAFPEKSLAEKNIIAKKFYKNLTDTFIETIKMISASDSKMLKRVTINLDEVIELAKKGKNIQFHAGHQFNWELANWAIGKLMPIPFIGVYMRINNKSIDKIFYNMRSKTGTVLISAHDFRNSMHQLMSKQYSIGLAADQNPANTSGAYWINFFNRPAPFVTGPDKGAIRNNTAVVFFKMIKTKRGHYEFTAKVIAEEGKDFKEGEITRLYRDFLESAVRENPDNYLWSHRRWKWKFEQKHVARWIDEVEPPVL